MTTPIVDSEPRCKGCHKLLAVVVTRPWEIRCTRCKALNGWRVQKVVKTPTT